MNKKPARKTRKPLPYWPFISAGALAVTIPFSFIEKGVEHETRTKEVMAQRLAFAEEEVDTPLQPPHRICKPAQIEADDGTIFRFDYCIEPDEQTDA